MGMQIIDYKTVFYRLLQDIQTLPLWAEMAATKENSPWHREESVAIHSLMVIKEFDVLIGDRTWTVEDMIGALACTFHDFGKPSARVEKFKPERGTYNSFGGHEIISARMWEDWAVQNWNKFNNLGLSSKLIYQVGFLIEHHLPYDIKDPHKRMNLAQTVVHMFDDWTVFERVLRADTWGRISDDHTIKKARVEGWIEQFKPLYDAANIGASSMEPYAILPDGFKTIFILVGSSGCGKSTIIEKMRADKDDVVFSWDKLRIDWYGDNTELDSKKLYRAAFETADKDSEFMNKANHEFTRIVKANVNKHNIFVDNTNLSAKRRRFFIEQGKRNQFRVLGVVLPIDLQTLKERARNRKDKLLPESVVCSQYMKVQLPLFGEVDEVIFSMGNLIQGT